MVPFITLSFASVNKETENEHFVIFVSFGVLLFVVGINVLKIEFTMFKLW